MPDKLIRWSDIRDEFMTPQEQAKCQAWLDELGKLMDARDTGKISVGEYCRLCFELDKRYGLAEDEDAELYLNGDTETNCVENDFNTPLVFAGA